MKKQFIKITLSILFILLSGLVVSENHVRKKITLPPNKILLYNNVWGTIYNAEERQCDNTPTITGDGSIINPSKASSLRWIAICHEMLDDSLRVQLLNDSTSERFKGKIQYGDTVWVESNNPNINGWWVVHDTKHKRVKNSIDFLQTKKDGTLYNNNKLWSGRFNNIKIFKINNIAYSNYE